MTTLPAYERVLRRIDTSDPDACWLWPGALSIGGYAVVGRNYDERPGNAYAHRVLYEHLVAPIPTGLQLDHLCHTRDLDCPGGATCPHRRCVNPAHMEPVTCQENLMRGINGRKTHCLRGHLLAAPNLVGHPKGHRVCRECKELRRRRYADALLCESVRA